MNKTYKICKTCRKQFTRQGNKGRGRFFCSNKCKQHTTKTKKKISDSLKGNKRALGHKLSEVAKLSISSKLSGRKLSKQTRKLLSKRRKQEWAENIRKKGWHLSQETRNKMSEIHKKENLSPKTRKKISQGNIRRWDKIGRKQYKRYIHVKDKKLILWRNSVFERDNYTCQKCGVKNCYLEAHHKKSWAKYPKLRYILTNGITLCKKCHNHTSNILKL